MYRLLFIFLTGSFCLSAYGQGNNIGLKLYYDINQQESKSNYARVDSFVNSIKAKTINIKLVGYADYLSNAEYNLQLSQKRADAIKSYIVKKYSDKVNVLSSTAVGDKLSEKLNSKEGDVSNRRVDIVIERVVPLHEVDTRPVKITTPAEAEEPSPAKSNKTIDLKNLEKGKSLTLEGLSFEPGRHYALRRSLPVLEKLLRTLKENPEVRIEIQGHVCCADGEEDGLDYDTYEKKLSYNRAKAVYDYLVKNGISAKRLTYKGFGHTRPKVDPENNEADEQMNRRVEILVLEN